MRRAALSLRRKRAALVWLACAAIATAVMPLVAGAAGNPPKAILLVSPSGSDKNPCTQVAPCASFGRAYRVAKPGQVVEVAAGTYPHQEIGVDKSKKTGRDVVFRPAALAPVTVHSVYVFGSHVELRDMQLVWEVKTGADHVTLRNIRSPYAVNIAGASNVSVLGGEVYANAPVTADSSIVSLKGRVPTNILIDGVYFHDFVDVGPGQYHHIECLQVGAAINLTIRKSKFRNCATHDIFIRSWGMENSSPYPLSNIVIENNWFAPTNVGYYAVQAWDDLWTKKPRTSIVIRNNSALQSILVRWYHGTAAVTGNIIQSMPAYFCAAYGQRKWFSYNVYGSGVPCGKHDRIGDPRYVDPTNFDLHLRAGSAAIGQGNPDNHPPSDIDRKRRPQKSPDAGASQWESANLTLGKSIGSASLGSARSDIVRFYGVPDEVSQYRVAGQSGTLATYRVHGGRLWVLYDRNNAVVGLGTTSPYYSTWGGYGVGVPTRRFVAAWNLRWDDCGKAYRRDFGKATLYVDSSRLGGPAQLVNSSVSSLWMVRQAFDDCGIRPH